MKKIFLFIIPFLFMGCLTTNSVVSVNQIESNLFEASGSRFTSWDSGSLDVTKVKLRRDVIKKACQSSKDAGYSSIMIDSHKLVSFGEKEGNIRYIDEYKYYINFCYTNFCSDGTYSKVSGNDLYTNDYVLNNDFFPLCELK